MPYYDFYRGAQAGWGTPGFQGVPPPAPLYQPQPNWTGIDYYTAHSGLRDDNIFDYIFNKVRDLVAGTGVGLNQATHWWKRVYGGLVDPSLLSPRELGAAAGYETIRLWETHQGIYAAPLADDLERQREAIFSIAAAEAAKLWMYTGRPFDKYGRMEASEVAAATASRIFLQTYDYESLYEPYNRNPRLRRRSISASRLASDVATNDIYDDATYYDDIQPDIVDTSYPARFRRGRPVSRSLTPGRRAVSPFPAHATAGNNLVAPDPVRAYGRSPSPMSVASIPGSPVLGFTGRHLLSPVPGGRYRSLTPMPYGAASPALLDPAIELGMNGLSPGFRGGLISGAYGGELNVGAPGGFGATGVVGGAVGPELAAMGANPTNVTYDPVLGPGIRGTYYPEAASRTAALGGYDGALGSPYGGAASLGMDGVFPDSGVMRAGPGYGYGVAGALPGDYGEYFGTGGSNLSFPGTFGRHGLRRRLSTPGRRRLRGF